jgi:signal transduction histidine kinase
MNGRILLVDDDAAVREAQREIISPQRKSALLLQGNSLFEEPAPSENRDAFEVVEASSGEEAVAVVRKSLEERHPFAVAFLDFRMAGMNGAETARRLWGMDPNLKMVLVTAFQDLPIEQIVETVGREDLFYLRKPFTTEEILQFARSLCSQWSLDRKREQDLLRAETAKARSLSVMAGAVAHHLNNLLAVIVGCLGLMEMKSPQNNETSRLIEMAQKKAEEGTVIGRQLLIYLGQNSSMRTPCNISEELMEVVNREQTRWSPPLRLETNLAENLPKIELDPLSFQDALHRVLINTFEAVNPEGGLIRCSTGMGLFSPGEWDKVIPSDTPERPCLYVEISDSGCGMDQETCDRMFDPFFSTKFTGRGLGLAVVQGIIWSHQGWIAVSSRVGEGTTLRLCFAHHPAGLKESPA